jgi:hypothetical protein
MVAGSTPIRQIRLFTSEVQYCLHPHSTIEKMGLFPSGHESLYDSPGKSGHIAVLRIRVVVPLLCVLSVVACVRTDDGSVVPKYQVTMVRTGWFPHLAMHRTEAARRRSAREGEFLPPPPPPEEPATEQPAAEQTKPRHHIRRRTHRRAKHIATRKPETAPKPSLPALKCQKVLLDTGKSRVRCD